MDLLPVFFDLLFVLFLLTAAYYGAARGLARTLLHLCSNFLSFLLALASAKATGKLLLPLAYSIGGDAAQEVFAFFDELAPVFLHQASKAAISAILGFVFSFIAFRAAFWILTRLLVSLFRLPVLRSFDAVLGGMLGAVSAAFFAWIFAGVAAAFLQSSPNHWLSTLDHTFFWNLLMEHDLLQLIKI